MSDEDEVMEELRNKPTKELVAFLGSKSGLIMEMNGGDGLYSNQAEELLLEVANRKDCPPLKELLENRRLYDWSDELFYPLYELIGKPKFEELGLPDQFRFLEWLLGALRELHKEEHRGTQTNVYEELVAFGLDALDLPEGSLATRVRNLVHMRRSNEELLDHNEKYAETVLEAIKMLNRELLVG